MNSERDIFSASKTSQLRIVSEPENQSNIYKPIASLKMRSKAKEARIEIINDRLSRAVRNQAGANTQKDDNPF